MNFEQERKYVGHPNQLFDIKEYRFVGGKSDGVRATDIDNGDGLSFTVLADRCMDISKLNFKGVNFGFITPVSVAAPTYYDNKDIEFLHNFTAGFMTTCGLSNIGSPCEYQGEKLGLHGRISNVPADYYCVTRQENDNGVTLSGQMHDGRLFGQNLLLHREITCKYKSNRILINDIVENIGFRDVEFQLLYHVNLGYPLLCESAKIILPTNTVQPRTEFSKKHQDMYDTITPPIDDLEEMCYYHKLKTNEENRTLVGLYNPLLKVGVTLSFSAQNLDHFVEWKSVASGEYVLGLEPCNSTIDGKQDAKENKSLKTIQKSEKISYQLEFSFFTGDEEYLRLLKQIEQFT